MNDYNYYNNDSVAVLIDNMFKCKNEIHVVKPLLKLLHDNNAIPRDNYNGINDGLQGFDTDLNEENKFYNNLVKNVQFRPNVNNEKNLVKLLADVYRKFDLSEEVLQSVILSWLVTNKEYNSSCNLINDANKLNNIMREYSQKKHGRVMVKRGGNDENLKKMVTEMFTLYDKQNITYNATQVINPNKNTLIYHLLKNIKVTEFEKNIIFNIEKADALLISVLTKINDDLSINKLNSTHLLIFTTEPHLNSWNKFTDLIILNVTNYLTDNNLDVVFKTIYHLIKNEHVPKDFKSYWTNVQEIVEKLKKPLNSNIGSSLIVSVGGNNNSYVNKAVVNNMLIGGGEFLLQLSKVNFKEVSKKFIEHLKYKGYNVESGDVTTLENLAEKVNESLNVYRTKVAEFYVTKYLEKKITDKTKVGETLIDKNNLSNINLLKNIVSPNKDNMDDLNKNLKEFFKFYNIYNKTINSAMSNVNKDHTDFDDLYKKYIIP